MLQQLPKTSKFYSRCKKCDIEKTVGGEYHLPLVAWRLNYNHGVSRNWIDDAEAYAPTYTYPASF